MFTDQRNELLRSYEKCNRVNKPEQAKNDKACQPIGISAPKKVSEKTLLIHRKDAAQRPTANIQRRINFGLTTSPIGDRVSYVQSEISRQRKNLKRSCQGGELNSRPRAYESPALPLSYPGVAAKRFNGTSQHVNAVDLTASSSKYMARGLFRDREVQP